MNHGIQKSLKSQIQMNMVALLKPIFFFRFLSRFIYLFIIIQNIKKNYVQLQQRIWSHHPSLSAFLHEAGQYMY